MAKWLAALCLTGCVSQMHPLEASWDGSRAPDCTDSEGAALGDAIAGEVAFSAGSSAARSGAHRGLGVLAMLAGTGLVMAAAVGEHEASRCRAAKAEWHIGNAVAARQRADRGPAAAPPPRGFYCTRSPTRIAVGACTRERAACEQAHALAVDAVADLSACHLVETAICFAGRCYPDAGACAAHRGPDSVGDCVEQR